MTTKTLFLLAGASLGLSSMAALAQEPVSRDEIRAMIADMLADSETRSSLLQGGGGAGYDKNFGIWSADGNYRLNFSGFMQIRYTANFRDSTGAGLGTNGNANTGSTDETNLGFGIRAAKIRLSGNVVNPDLKFAIQIASEFGGGHDTDSEGQTASGASGFSGQFYLDDAIVNYNLGNGWSIYGGQFKLRFMKEDSNHEVYTMAAERGPIVAAFGQYRSQGVGVMYKAEQWNWGVEFSDGLRTANTDFTSLRESDFAVTSRFEYRFCGTDDQLKDYTSLPGEQLGANIGAAVHYQLANNDPALAFKASYFSYTIDGQVEGGGWSLFAAFVGGHQVGTYGAPGGAFPAGNSDNYGWAVQGAWRFMPNDELFLRYDGMYIDRNIIGPGRRDFHFLTFGYNHYFAGHAAKLTIDCIIGLVTDGSLFTAVSGPIPNGSNATDHLDRNVIPNTGLGLLGVSNGTEAAVRIQFQLMF